MERALRAIGLIAVIATCSGCGTLLTNHFSGPCCYGGVATDARSIAEQVSARDLWLVPDSNRPARHAPLAALGVAFTVCDLPLSALADTLILPFWIAENFRMPNAASKPTAVTELQQEP
jgi:uncharacterized protein YceK